MTRGKRRKTPLLLALMVTVIGCVLVSIYISPVSPTSKTSMLLMRQWRRLWQLDRRKKKVGNINELSSSSSSIFVATSHVSRRRHLSNYHGGGSAEEAEEYLHELEEESEQVTVSATVLVIFLLLIALTMLFDYAKERMEEKAGRHMRPIIESLFGELTTLGFLSACTFVLEELGIFLHLSKRLFGAEHEEDEEELFHIFEIVHFTLFFVMVVFVVQILHDVKAGSRTEKEWLEMDRDCRDPRYVRTLLELKEREEHGHSQEGKKRWYYKVWRRIGPYLTFLPQLRNKESEGLDDKIFFYGLREEFILERCVDPPFRPTDSQYRVRPDFNFGRYLSVNLGKKMAQVVEVDTKTWAFFAVLGTIFFVCVLVLDANLVFLSWIWVGIGYAVFAFNVGFENYILDVRRKLAPSVDATMRSISFKVQRQEKRQMRQQSRRGEHHYQKKHEQQQQQQHQNYDSGIVGGGAGKWSGTNGAGAVAGGGDSNTYSSLTISVDNNKTVDDRFKALIGKPKDNLGVWSSTSSSSSSGIVAMGASGRRSGKETDHQEGEEEEEENPLPGWCHVDLPYYLRKRSCLTKLFSGRRSKPNRHHTLYWFEKNGPKFHLLVLRINLVFLGTYCAMLLLVFVPFMIRWTGENGRGNRFWLVVYIIACIVPILAILLNKRRLIAAMIQVGSVVSFRLPQAVSQADREERTVRAVRVLVVLHKLHRAATSSSFAFTEDNNKKTRKNLERREYKHWSLRLNHEVQSELSKTFDFIDIDHDGRLSSDEFQCLMGMLGAPVEPRSIRNMIEAVGGVAASEGGRDTSKDDFLQWYADLTGLDDDHSKKKCAKFLFDLFDRDRNGVISVTNFKETMDALQMGFTNEEVGEIVNEMDVTNDGVLSLMEFRNLLERYYPKELEYRDDTWEIIDCGDGDGSFAIPKDCGPHIFS